MPSITSVILSLILIVLVGGGFLLLSNLSATGDTAGRITGNVAFVSETTPADRYVNPADNRTLTIANNGASNNGNQTINVDFNSVSWAILTDFPASCPIGFAVQTIATIPTCIAISSSGQDDDNAYLNQETYDSNFNFSFAGRMPLNDGNITNTGLFKSNCDNNILCLYTGRINTFLDSNFFTGLIRNYLDFNAVIDPVSPDANISRLHAFTFNGVTRLQADNEEPTDVVLGRDSFILARNNGAGADFNKGNVVYIFGSATADLPTIRLSQANNFNLLPALGLAVDDIPTGTNGNVITHGVLTGIDTSAFSDGNEIYVSPTKLGGLTNVRPNFPSFSQRIGTVITSAVNGSIAVQVAPFIPTQQSQGAWSGGWINQDGNLNGGTKIETITQNVYVDFRDFNSTNVRNFTMSDFNMIPVYDGNYDVSFNLNAFHKGANTKTFEIGVFKNDVEQLNCKTETELNSGSIINNTSFSCILPLIAGDKVVAKIRCQDTPAQAILVRNFNLILKRMGD